MASIANITFACEDPAGLAEFWTAALHYEIQNAPPGLFEAIEAEGGDTNAAAAAVDPRGEVPRLFFKKLPRSSPEHIRFISTSQPRTARRRSSDSANSGRRSSRRKRRPSARTPTPGR